MAVFKPTTSRMPRQASNRSSISTYIINPAAEDEVSLDIIFDEVSFFSINYKVIILMQF